MIKPYSPMQKRPGVISYGTSHMGYDVRLGWKFKVPDSADLTNAVIDPKEPRELAESRYKMVDLTPSHDWLEEKFPGDMRTRPHVVRNCRGCGLDEDEASDRCTAALERNGDFIVIPPNSFVLGESVEWFDIPRDIGVVCVGKSTYARCAIIVNVTPGEPEWSGRWTIEITNSNPKPVKVYCGEGIMQCVFFRADGVYQQAFAEIHDWMVDQVELGNLDHKNIVQLRQILDRTSAVGTCRVSYADKKGKYHLQDGLTLPAVDGENEGGTQNR